MPVSLNMPPRRTADDFAASASEPLTLETSICMGLVYAMLALPYAALIAGGVWWLGA